MIPSHYCIQGNKQILTQTGTLIKYLRQGVFFHSSKLTVHKNVKEDKQKSMKGKVIINNEIQYTVFLQKSNACLPRKDSVAFFILHNGQN
jgi:hypothetical protein